MCDSTVQKWKSPGVCEQWRDNVPSTGSPSIFEKKGFAQVQAAAGINLEHITLSSLSRPKRKIISVVKFTETETMAARSWGKEEWREWQLKIVKIGVGDLLFVCS